MQTFCGLVLLATAVAEKPRPQVPQRFSAHLWLDQHDLTGVSTGQGLYAQDGRQRVMRVEANLPKSTSTLLLTNMTYVVVDNRSYDLTGGTVDSEPLCRHIPMGPFGPTHFVDLFGWVSDPSSTYVGERVVNGVECSLWRSQNGSMSLCAKGDLPVELNTSITYTSFGKEGSSNSSCRFGNVTVGDVVPQFLFEKPSVCNEGMPAPCKDGVGRAPVKLDAYVYHPGMSPADYNVSDQNVADLAGEALFICLDLIRMKRSIVDHNYTHISRYSLQLSPAYGQYALCNGYPDTTPPGPSCLDGDLRLVGREAPFFAGPGELRCADKSPIGFWYGLPAAGRCPDGTSPEATAATGGCTWAVEKRIKTIRQKCLLEGRGLLEMCQKDYEEQKGFPRTEEAITLAFSEPSKGGCPDVYDDVVVI